MVFLVILTLLLGGLHGYVDHYFFPSNEYVIPIYFIYIFNFLLVLIVYTLLNYIQGQDSSKVFVYFMGATLIKMILAIVFLLPVLLSEAKNAKEEVIHFFVPYFIYLAFEVSFITRLLREK